MKLSSYMSLLSKRGLSTVVTTLIIVLLVIVAIGIIWAVIGNLIRTGSEEVNTGRISLSIDIKNVKDVLGFPDQVEVTVKRNVGEGNLKDLKFVLDDGTNTEVVTQENVGLVELGEATYTFDKGMAIGTNIIKKVSVIPVYESSSGKKIDGGIVDVWEGESGGGCINPLTDCSAPDVCGVYTCVSGACQQNPLPFGTGCPSDSNFCNGVELCDGIGTDSSACKSNGVDPCAIVPDDGFACTDHCDSAGTNIFNGCNVKRDSYCAPPAYNYDPGCTAAFCSATSGTQPSGCISTSCSLSWSQTVTNIGNILSWYKFDDVGNLGLDTRGTHPGTAINGPSQTSPGARTGTNQAIRLYPPNNGDAVSSSTAKRIDLLNNWYFSEPFSIVVWFKTTSTSGSTSTSNNRIIGDKGTAGIMPGVSLSVHNGYELWITDESNNNIVRWQSTTAGYNDNAWHMAVVTVQKVGFAREVKLYFDGSGTPVQSATITCGFSCSNNLDGGYNMQIAGLNTGTTTYHTFNGDLDDVVIFSKALQPAEIQDLYSST